MSPGYCRWVTSCVFDKAERAGTLPETPTDRQAETAE
jgi:hypothetical protein